MKIKQEHYNFLKEKMKVTLHSKGLTGKQIINDYIIKKIGNDHTKRACFDVLYASNLSNFICKELYSYMNDDHIYSAIKKIMQEI